MAANDGKLLDGANRQEDSGRSAHFHPNSYIFAGADAVAMHCHLPLGIFIQVSTQRS